MTPELIDLIINLGGNGVAIWVIIRLQSQIEAMRAEANADRQQLWHLLSYLIHEHDSRTDIPILPSQRAKQPRDE